MVLTVLAGLTNGFAISCQVTRVLVGLGQPSAGTVPLHPMRFLICHQASPGYFTRCLGRFPRNWEKAWKPYWDPGRNNHTITSATFCWLKANHKTSPYSRCREIDFFSWWEKLQKVTLKRGLHTRMCEWWQLFFISTVSVCLGCYNKIP